MTTYTQGQQSIYLEDVWSMEVAASSIVFHGPGADVSVTFMNPAAADAEYLVLFPLWESARSIKPYDRSVFIRSAMELIAEGLLANEETLKALNFASSREGLDAKLAFATKVIEGAIDLADRYEAEFPP